MNELKGYGYLAEINSEKVPVDKKYSVSLFNESILDRDLRYWQVMDVFELLDENQKSMINIYFNNIVEEDLSDTVLNLHRWRWESQDPYDSDQQYQLESLHKFAKAFDQPVQSILARFIEEKRINAYNLN
tara:strand:- start:191 stop:580 length:390 start_codon:yes stop_codon:yes gene_type:complete